MIAHLMEPFGYEFFRNGFAVATLAGALCGMVGVFIVVRGMSYLTHGLAHAVFGGFAASALFGVSFLLGAGAWGVGAALAVNSVARRRPIGADAAIGVVTTASFAAGLVLFSIIGKGSGSFEAILFGSVLGVGPGDVIVVALATVVVVCAVAACYRPLLFTTFDPEVAQASGLNTRRIEAMLMVIIAVSILVSMQVLGVTLIAAALVIPPATARLLTGSFPRMLAISSGLGAFCGALGMMLSYQLDVQSGPMIVLLASAVFLAVFVARRPGSLQRRYA